jgi:hypothetical protein
VNAHPDFVRDPPHGRLELFRQAIGEAAVPRGTTDGKLSGWSKALTLRETIHAQIQASVRARADDIRYRQLFHFHYQDDARMLTVGGLLASLRQRRYAVPRARWNDFHFVRTGADPFRIGVPQLTIKELQHLDAQLPFGEVHLSGHGLSSDELAEYAKVYRYYPRFAGIDV